MSHTVNWFSLPIVAEMKKRESSGSPLYVLWAYICHANFDNLAWPRLHTVAKEIDYGYEATQKGRKVLIDLQILVRASRDELTEEEKKTCPKQRHVYRIRPFAVIDGKQMPLFHNNYDMRRQEKGDQDEHLQDDPDEKKDDSVVVGDTDNDKSLVVGDTDIVHTDIVHTDNSHIYNIDSISNIDSIPPTREGPDSPPPPSSVFEAIARLRFPGKKKLTDGERKAIHILTDYFESVYGIVLDVQTIEDFMIWQCCLDWREKDLGIPGREFKSIFEEFLGKYTANAKLIFAIRTIYPNYRDIILTGDAATLRKNVQSNLATITEEVPMHLWNAIREKLHHWGGSWRANWYYNPETDEIIIKPHTGWDTWSMPRDEWTTEFTSEELQPLMEYLAKEPQQ